MSAAAIWLNNKKYDLAHEDLVPRGAKRFDFSLTPSQPGHPSQLLEARWRIDGPNLQSREVLSGPEGGPLGIDYCDGTDSRWADVLCLGPKIHVIDVSGEGGTTESTHAMAMVDNGTEAFLYGCRGTVPAKINLRLGSVVSSGITLSNKAFSVFASRSANGNREVTFGFASDVDDDYFVITTIGNTTDTGSDNDDMEEIAFFLQDRNGRVLGLGGEDNPRRIASNVLTGSVTMDAPAWSEVAVLDGPPNLAFTGGALDGNLPIIGTSDGPYLIDPDLGKFYALIEEIQPDDENCRGMTTWFPMGVIIPLADGVRWFHAGAGRSWGVETFEHNTSPVQGAPTAHAGTTKWLYQAVPSVVDSNTYLLAWRPTQLGDNIANEYAPFVIANLGEVDCRVLFNVGKSNGRTTQPQIYGGHDSDVFRLIEGRMARQINDPNYAFNTDGGTAYFTEMRRYPGLIKDLEAVEFVSEDCSSTETITIGVSVDGATAETLTGNLVDEDGNSTNGVVKTDGQQRLRFVNDDGSPLKWAAGEDSGYRIKPQATFATSASAFSPRIVGGWLTLYYRVRPRMARVVQFSLQLGDTPTRSRKAAEDALSALVGKKSKPVTLRDPDGREFYVQLDPPQFHPVGPDGTRIATVSATEWAVA